MCSNKNTAFVLCEIYMPIHKIFYSTVYFCDNRDKWMQILTEIIPDLLRLFHTPLLLPLTGLQVRTWKNSIYGIYKNITDQGVSTVNLVLGVCRPRKSRQNHSLTQGEFKPIFQIAGS